MNKGPAYDVYARAHLKYEDKMYHSALQLFKDCIQAISEMDAIELLPKVLQEVTVCCEQLGDLNQAAMFKNFERQYYETVLMRHQLDLIDEEKENLKHIQNRAADLEGLARLCDENDCAKLAMDYMTKAAVIRRNKLGRSNSETQRSLDLFAQYHAKAGEAQYKTNVETVRKSNPNIFRQPSEQEKAVDDGGPLVRKRTSILKLRRDSNSTLLDTPKKKVHFPDALPRYTDEKKRRSLQKLLQVAVWLAMVHFLLPLVPFPKHLSHLMFQTKVVAWLLGVIFITR